ncbi:hypothetical protein COCSUDRAFT_63711 [Coccomyxa subellipsoidea C-169]|uniref:Uncharacterized protein n=1 Tax=Coccomyxa subellipsoidea (strain C-169) TaxID=574566 RepID=I0YVZ4_COCSC|nr:hypothetical protein COCSUDRAFT_63711 [Coccomyxa subellipsoidea C-169]EIE22563.1 hypothetical protein COCSUDRAFT_63711 [Coccomyxa subellipsoidea C-169]|eukprot:XP_005647107.1 hypothetical protein COCSUDRAFT_63711 [Coccomyxa subellipsoidea C-169]
MGSYVTDLGMHMLHLMLSGPQHLMLEDQVPSGKKGDSGDVCVGKTGCVNEGAEGELCGARSSRVYCMDLPATDFRENDIRRHTLGSTCAPGGMRSVHDQLYNDYCTRRFPATQSVYFSEERCSLLPDVQCST